MKDIKKITEDIDLESLTNFADVDWESIEEKFENSNYLWFNKKTNNEEIPSIPEMQSLVIDLIMDAYYEVMNEKEFNIYSTKKSNGFIVRIFKLENDKIVDIKFFDED